MFYISTHILFYAAFSVLQCHRIEHPCILVVAPTFLQRGSYLIRRQVLLLLCFARTFQARVVALLQKQ